MKSLILTLLVFIAINTNAQQYLNKTEATIRNEVNEEIHSFYDRTGCKVIYWYDNYLQCRVLNYISNPTQKVFSTILMIDNTSVGKWVEKLNSDFIATSNNSWTDKREPTLIITLTKDDDNNGWIIYITDRDLIK